MAYKSHLFEFAYFPCYNDDIKDLAENLALKENWDFGSPSSNKNYQILKNYLEFTYRKLNEEKQIKFTSTNDFACFNTGLVTNNYEDIYAFFEKNKNTNPKSHYFFKRFLKYSDNQFLREFCNHKPEVANYFDKPDLLLFNPKYEIVPDIDHIITDNIDRFPNHLKSSDNNELRRQLIGAIDYTKKKVRNNYKIAVPQYYNSKIQLLLPLYFTQNSPNPDLALVIHKIKDGTYSAETVLKLEMAYQNARLIVRPESNWLKP